MTDKIEIQGKTVREAVSEALLQMGARRDEVNVEVLDEPKSGFLGFIGGKQARVVVSRKRGGARGRSGQRDDRNRNQGHSLSDKGAGRGASGGGPRRRGRNSAGRGRNSGNDGPETRGARSGNGGGARSGGSPRSTAERGTAEKSAAEKSTRNSSPGNDSGESRRSSAPGRRRGGRGRSRGQRQDSSKANNQQERQTMTNGQPPARKDDSQDRPPRQESGRRPNPRNRERSPGAGAAQVAEKVIATNIAGTSYAQPLRNVAEDKIDATLNDLAGGMLIRAGFPCRCEVLPGEYRQIRIVTDDSSAGMLIGRQGATVDAVEHIVERMASTAAGDRVRMNLDINNYRRRRTDSLEARVGDVARQVLESGEEIHMDTMNARDRRIVHLEIAETEGLKTFTVPDEHGKHVVIAPEGAPDPDAAEAPQAEPEGESQDS